MKKEEKIRPKRVIHVYRKKRKLRAIRVIAAVLLILLAAALINYKTTKNFVSSAISKIRAEKEENLTEIAKNETAQEPGLFKKIGSWISGKIEGTKLVARINGREVREGDFAKRYDIFLFIKGIPADYKSAMDKKVFLEQVINDELLLDASDKAGINVGMQEVNYILADAINKSSLSQDEVKTLLKNRGLSLSDLRVYYERTLRVIKLLNETIENNVNVTEKEALSAYEGSIASYTAKTGEIRLREITLNSSKQADEILADIKGGEDFGKMAYFYSEDKGSSLYGGDIGFVSRSMLPADIAKAAFALKAGQIAKTSWEGKYYLLKREADIVSFDELKAGIISSLSSSKRNQLFNEYLASLRAGAKIEYFSWAAENSTKEE